MEYHNNRRALALAFAIGCTPLAAWAYDSGSTGADGAFAPTVDTVLTLPPDGIFNFTEVDIPAGVTVSFKKNAMNTPVTLLVSGNANIAGTLHVNGGWSPPVGAAGDGNVGDDGLPGEGGPGGYDGGVGGEIDPGWTLIGGNGLGPGGGGGGGYYAKAGTPAGGGGGGYAVAGNSSYGAGGGSAYGTALLLPLIGGSGGGGGDGGSAFRGSGGGGGGGALLIAAGGTVTINGIVSANGGSSGDVIGGGVGAAGGAGSGGAIRVIATEITGNGGLWSAWGEPGATPNSYFALGGRASAGRIRLEAEVFGFTSTTTPQFTFGDPGPVFIAGLPALRIASVAGVAAPAAPTGSADIVLPADTPNPVTVVFETHGVPVGNTVTLTVTPAIGAPASALSPALTGTTDSATASVGIDLPAGPSTLRAETSYTVVAAVGDALAPYAGGERVERVHLAAGMNGESQVTLVTVSGREYPLPAHLPLLPAG